MTDRIYALIRHYAIWIAFVGFLFAVAGIFLDVKILAQTSTLVSRTLLICVFLTLFRKEDPKK